MRCEKCSASIDAGSLWCPSCGIWTSSVTAICEGPETDQAVGACVVCGQPVCAVCGTMEEGRTVCTDPSHQALIRSHSILDVYTSQFEADWVAKNLQQAGLHVNMFAYRDHPGLYGLTLPTEAVIYVQKDDLKKAQEIVLEYSEKKGA